MLVPYSHSYHHKHSGARILGPLGK
jgi:hypothetical protein